MSNQSARPRSDTKVALICAGIALGMVGLAYASVPLYRLFCQITGFAGTTQRAIAPSTEILDRKMTIRFDSNVAPGLEWEFVPEATTTEIRIGENGLAFYRATNRGSVPLVGTATYNVTPEQAGAFFNKVQCFCFTEQKLEPGETIEMPVSYFVDPAIVKDPDGALVRTITLSYTFHPVAKPSTNSAAVAPSSAGGEGRADSSVAPPG